MSEWKSLSDAAKTVGIHRVTLRGWIDRGLLKTRSAQVRNLTATLVNMVVVRKLVAKGVKPGRPKKKG
jgi:predicted site-specific integrase-resolvase